MIEKEELDKVAHIRTLQDALSEKIQIFGLYVAYNNKPASMSVAKNDRQLPSGSKITVEEYEDAWEWISQFGGTIDELYNSLSPNAKLLLDAKELHREKKRVKRDDANGEDAVTVEV